MRRRCAIASAAKAWERSAAFSSSDRMDGAKLARPAERCLGVHQALTWLGDEAMKRHLGTTHLWVGLATLFFFAVTGQLMDRWNLDQMSIESALRQLYRSRHIYLLFGGLVNLAVSMRFGNNGYYGK